jgi:membrane protease subunit (stomatin/prohibitin family)
MANFLDVIEHFDPTGQEMVARMPSDGSAETNIGSQLVVQESQEAVLFRDGRALDVFGPGRHTLSTLNIPLLSKLINLPFGGTSPFRVAVVFVNKRTFIDQKWGTREPVAFRDSELGLVRLRAFGTYAIRVKDSQLFVNTVVGSQGRFGTAQIADFYRDIIVSRLNDLMGETMKSILDLPSVYDELGAAAKARITEDFSKYGIDLTDFYVGAITPPEEVQKRIDERASMGALGNLDQYMKYKAAQALGDAAKNESGVAGAGIGLGLGAGLGAMLPGMIQNAMQSGASQGAAGAAGPAAAGGAAAGGAAAAASGAKFCSECGTAVTPAAKFCGQCGGKLA